MNGLLFQLLNDFQSTLEVVWHPPSYLITAAEAAIRGCGEARVLDASSRKARLLALVNSKLGLNKATFKRFLDGAASHRVFLNYHDKVEARECFDSCDVERFRRWLEGLGINPLVEEFFCPVREQETLDGLRTQLSSGKVVRRDARQCHISERRDEVLRSLFGSYVFSSFPRRTMHAFFNPDSASTYYPDFYQHLLHFQPSVLRRDCALIFLIADAAARRGSSADEFRDRLAEFLTHAYERLSNHCYLAVLIRPFETTGEDEQWRLFSDIILFAEKHREVSLKTGYFNPAKMSSATADHIPAIDLARCAFHIANEGFFFKDCFVLAPGDDLQAIGRLDTPVDLLLLFQKNERDETLIPCPGCRSDNVAGNSYPVLGERSWECQNPICPERSAFDRGNRYSLASLVKQEAIKADADQIPRSSLRKWKLDVVTATDILEVIDMLVRHFSLRNDRVVLVNGPKTAASIHGRHVVHEDFPQVATAGSYAKFQESAFFRRFIVARPASDRPMLAKTGVRIDRALIYQGECFEVLSNWDGASVDGAVTSPPYYNARSYSTWPNIYCYLYDMFNTARQVFRVLKPGSMYLFNVFDYFDNENNVVLSTMGKKRMILGAYIITLFRRVGFLLRGNVVWYKGEIEGKRNFNQGNRSPYYQFPFNCWEHVLIFQKPGTKTRTYQFPTVLSARPVVKMIRGKNVLGHTAPFPPEIPRLLLDQMKNNELVLDPFAGSMTTARAAQQLGVRSASIELHQEYCELGLRLLRADAEQLPLFRHEVDVAASAQGR